MFQGLIDFFKEKFSRDNFETIQFDYVSQEELAKYVTPSQRLDFIYDRTEDKDNGENYLKDGVEVYEKEEFFLKVLEDDKTFEGLSKYTGFSSGLNLSDMIEHEAEESLFPLINIYANFEVDFDLKQKNYKKLLSPLIGIFESADENKRNKKADRTQSWYQLGLLYRNCNKQRYKCDQQHSEEYLIEPIQMSYFIDAWRIVFDEKTQKRVVEILQDNPNYFSLENIYNLSVLGYNEMNGKDFEISIFTSPIEWIQASIPEVNCQNFHN